MDHYLLLVDYYPTDEQLRHVDIYFLATTLNWMDMSSPCPRGRTPCKPAAGEYVGESFLTFVKSSDSLATNRRGGGSLAEWLGAGLSIRRRRVQVPPWPLAGFVHSSPEFKSSTMLVNSQLVCRRPVGILNLLCLILIICFSHLLNPTSISAIN